MTPAGTSPPSGIVAFLFTGVADERRTRPGPTSLAEKEMTVIRDNCEHLVEMCATLAEGLAARLFIEGASPRIVGRARSLA